MENVYRQLVNYYVKEKYTLRYTGGMVPDVNQVRISTALQLLPVMLTSSETTDVTRSSVGNTFMVNQLAWRTEICKDPTKCFLLKTTISNDIWYTEMHGMTVDFSTDDRIDDQECLFDATLNTSMINQSCQFHFNTFRAKERQSFRQCNVAFGNKKIWLGARSCEWHELLFHREPMRSNYLSLYPRLL
jgi:hypothetical protein